MMHDHLTESVGRAMMTRRLERHISQAELARAMGLNQSDVSEIESGRRTALGRLQSAAIYLGFGSLSEMIWQAEKGERHAKL